MTDLVGRVLSGRYRLTAPIGAGASAQVFLAEDTRLKRRVAVKLLHAGLADDEGVPPALPRRGPGRRRPQPPAHRRRLRLGRRRRHPLPRHRAARAGGACGACSTPASASRRSQALLVGLEAARALDYAHRQGFVHRDIKPANLLFGEDGRLRIADFGLARALAEAAWTEPAGAVVGTARYASPEQARGEAVDGRADVYALGLTLIEAVTGKVPFASRHHHRHADGPHRHARRRARRPRPAADRCWSGPASPTPDDRPDAGEFGVGLMAAAEDLERPEPLPLVGAMPVIAATATSDPTLLPVSPSDNTDAVATVGTATIGTATIGTATTGTATVATVPPPGRPAVYDHGDERELVDDPPRKRRWWLRILIAVLVLGLLAGGGYLAANTLLVPSHDVPTLVGLDEAAATELIEENGWEVERLEDRDDDSVAGQVLRQYARGRDVPGGGRDRRDRGVARTPAARRPH